MDGAIWGKWNLQLMWRDVWRVGEAECVQNVKVDIFHQRDQWAEVSSDSYKKRWLNASWAYQSNNMSIVYWVLWPPALCHCCCCCSVVTQTKMAAMCPGPPLSAPWYRFRQQLGRRWRIRQRPKLTMEGGIPMLPWHCWGHSTWHGQCQVVGVHAFDHLINLEVLLIKVIFSAQHSLLPNLGFPCKGLFVCYGIISFKWESIFVSWYHYQ